MPNLEGVTDAWTLLMLLTKAVVDVTKEVNDGFYFSDVSKTGFSEWFSISNPCFRQEKGEPSRYLLGIWRI